MLYVQALKIMGFTKPPSNVELKKRYRELCRKYHPDMIQGEKEKIKAQCVFQEINSAYEVLQSTKPPVSKGAVKRKIKVVDLFTIVIE